MRKINKISKTLLIMIILIGLFSFGISHGASTDNAIPKWHETSETVIQNTGVIIDDSNNITTPGSITATGGVGSTATSSGGGYASFSEDTDFGTNFNGWGVYGDITASTLLGVPLAAPAANQLLLFGAPGNQTMSDGETISISMGTWRDYNEYMAWTIHDSDVDTAVADGKQYHVVPTPMNGMELVGVIASVDTAGTTGTTDIQIRRVRGASAVDMLSTKATIDSGERDTATAATAYVINTSNDDLATADRIFIDLDAISTTAAKGLSVTLWFK